MHQRCNLKVRSFFAASLLTLGVLGAVGPVEKAFAADNAPTYVSTFESIGLYWNPGLSNQVSLRCFVQYRVLGSQSSWSSALELWYDSRSVNGRPPELRGSIVNLRPDTEYEVKLTLSNGLSATIRAKTMSEHFPVGETVYLPKNSAAELHINTGGTPDAYKLYTFDPTNGSATIDVQNAARTCITVSAPYVIIRGITCTGARNHGIALEHGAHHIVIEENDISNWGSERSPGTGLGVDYQAGVHGAYHDPSINNIVIQRNRIHSPRYTANSWDTGHPAGPQGISFEQDGGGHNIFRYNEIIGDDTHYFNDAISGGENYSYGGAPGPDSDIYGNIIIYSWDDGIEVEGGGMNVRVWGNYIDKSMTGISSAATTVGPLYIFRNVYNTSRHLANVPLDKDDRGGFGKAGDDRSDPRMGGGRRYFFHNTTLQAPPPPGSSLPLGAGQGIYDAGGPLTNTVSRNNIWHIWKPTWESIGDSKASTTNDFDYDLYNGRIAAYAGAEANGIKGVPIYAPGNGWVSGSGGQYALDPSSPGYHQAIVLPNFNDWVQNPDIGAHQSGTPPMQFGVNGGR